MKAVTVGVLLLSFVLCGCEQLPQLFQKKAAPLEERVEFKISGPLLARVDGWAIGTEDFNNYLNAAKPLLEGQNVDVTNPDVRKMLLNELVRQQILARVAAERGLDKDADFQRALRDTKTTLLVSRMRAELERTIEVTYAEIENFYNQNKALLRQPPEMKVREIMVTSEPLAREVYIRILQGDDFTSLARQYSVAETASKGGDLGYMTYDPNVKFAKFWEVVASLDAGEQSSIFKDEQDNSYIIKVEDIRGGQEIPISEVEEQLRIGLRADKIEREVTNIVNAFRARANVEINEDLVR